MKLSKSDLIHTLNIKKSAAYKILNNPHSISSSHAIELFIRYNIHYENPLIISPFNYSNLYDFSKNEFIYWNNLDELMSIYNLNTNSLCETLLIDIKTFKLRSARGMTPILADAKEISKFFNISIPLMFTEDIDFECVRNNLKSKMKKNTYIPDIFTFNGGSKMRTFKHATDFVSQQLDENVIKEILNSLQISPEALNMNEMAVSIYLFNQFHKKTRLFIDSDDFFISMGFENINNLNNRAQFSQFKEVAKAKTPKGFYQKVVKYLVPKVDQNYHYEINVVSNTCIELYSCPKERLMRNNKSVGSREVMLYRFGHLISAPGYIDLPMPSREKSTYHYKEDTDEAVFRYIY